MLIFSPAHEVRVALRELGKKATIEAEFINKLYVQENRADFLYSN